jgi:hypothetical protein
MVGIPLKRTNYEEHEKSFEKERTMYTIGLSSTKEAFKAIK